MFFKRFVTGFQMAALCAVGITVVFLFTKEPPSSSASTTASAGAVLYAERCASCHGPNGMNGTAPQLAGRVVAQYPNVADQIALVTDGKGTMPAFGGQLSTEQIGQVVDFTRGITLGPGGTGVASAPIDAKALYLDNCAACHGDFGEGTYAPAFKNGAVAQKYPDKAAELKIVKDGIPPSMKAFGDQLTPEQLEAIVEYTRSL